MPMKILIIDDDPDMRLITRMSLLTDPECEVLESESGREGIELAGSAGPDAIVLDLQLQDMSGEEVLAELRARKESREIPVLFLTAVTDANRIGELEAKGAALVINKPFDPTSLLAKVRGVVD
jgi:DNA-binding response OmpR family regulator